MKSPRHRCVLIAGLLAASVATAQQAPAPAGGDAVPPKHSCTKPGDYPGSLASENQRRAWQKDYIGYTDCLKKFINDQKAIAEPHVKAYNAAIEEYNEGVRAFNEQVEKARAASGK
jgi:hypothetical protein